MAKRRPYPTVWHLSDLLRDCRDQAAMADLRNKGASCHSCRSFERKAPVGLKGTWCAADSDFHGYAMVKSTDLCLKYVARAANI
jgi:hypothetical protein